MFHLRTGSTPRDFEERRILGHPYHISVRSGRNLTYSYCCTFDLLKRNEGECDVQTHYLWYLWSR